MDEGGKNREKCNRAKLKAVVSTATADKKQPRKARKLAEHVISSYSVAGNRLPEGTSFCIIL